MRELGIDLPTAIRMFLKRPVQVQGIPFSMQLSKEEYRAMEARYSSEKYPKYDKYDNYDAISIDKVTDIPCDYDGIMEVFT